MADERTEDHENQISDLPGAGAGAVPTDPLHSDKGDLTPPHGDDLRDEETFGRTDRYSNIDDADAARERPVGRSDPD
jgi:hypothetical protein